MMAYFQIYNVYAVLLTLSVPQLKDVLELFQSFLHSLTQFTPSCQSTPHCYLVYHPLSPSSLLSPPLLLSFCVMCLCVCAVFSFSFPVHFALSRRSAVLQQRQIQFSRDNRFHSNPLWTNRGFRIEMTCRDFRLVTLCSLVNLVITLIVTPFIMTT